MILAALLATAFATGGALYQNECASCHGAALQGSTQAPALLGVGAEAVDFMLRTGRMPAATTGWQDVRHPPVLDAREIDALVAYVVGRSHGSPKLPRVRSGDAFHGRAVFAENCAACHGVTGSGGSVGNANVAPALDKATPVEVAEAVRIGPDVMPRFNRDVLSDRDVDDIVAYLALFRNSQLDPGGIAMENLGPVAEGFVAWAVGIGLLLLCIRWIATIQNDAR